MTNATLPKKQDLNSFFFDQCPFDPDKPILIDVQDQSRTISWREARTMVRKLGAGFRKMGVKPGDCVCLLGRSDITNFIIAYGCMAAGAVYSPPSFLLKPDEILDHIRLSDASFILTDPEYLDIAVRAAKELNIDQSKLMIVKEGADAAAARGFQSWESLLQHGEEDWLRLGDEATTTTAFRFGTSGTTGKSKLACISHYASVAQTVLCTGMLLDKDYDVRYLYYVPMFHVSASCVMAAALAYGPSVFITRDKSAEGVLAALEELKITDMFLIPSNAVEMLRSPAIDAKRFATVRDVTCGAAPLPISVNRRLKKYLPKDCRVWQAYGMTENVGVSTAWPWPEHGDPEAVGRECPFNHLRMVDGKGQDISGTDTIGEVHIKGPCVFQGYYKNPEANANVFTSDGWLRTGDLGLKSPLDGSVKLMGRKKELFKIDNEEISPQQVEDVLLAHPSVSEAVIYPKYYEGLVDPTVHAKVVLNEGANGITAEELIAHTRAQVAEYKVPTGGITFVDSLPKNPSGKILRNMVQA